MPPERVVFPRSFISAVSAFWNNVKVSNYSSLNFNEQIRTTDDRVSGMKTIGEYESGERSFFRYPKATLCIGDTVFVSDFSPFHFGGFLPPTVLEDEALFSR